MNSNEGLLSASPVPPATIPGFAFWTQVAPERWSPFTRIRTWRLPSASSHSWQRAGWKLDSHSWCSSPETQPREHLSLWLGHWLCVRVSRPCGWNPVPCKATHGPDEGRGQESYVGNSVCKLLAVSALAPMFSHL